MTLVDPVVGTLLIEGAMRSASAAWMDEGTPQRIRLHRWHDHPGGDFIDYLETLEARIRPIPPGMFIGADRDRKWSTCAENFRRTGIQGELNNESDSMNGRA